MEKLDAWPVVPGESRGLEQQARAVAAEPIQFDGTT
jgi:hypothetical protein